MTSDRAIEQFVDRLGQLIEESWEQLYSEDDLDLDQEELEELRASVRYVEGWTLVISVGSLSTEDGRVSSLPARYTRRGQSPMMTIGLLTTALESATD